MIVVDRSVSRRRIPKNWPCHILRFETMTPYLASPSKMAMYTASSHIHTDPIPSLSSTRSGYSLGGIYDNFDLGLGMTSTYLT